MRYLWCHIVGSARAAVDRGDEGVLLESGQPKVADLYLTTVKSSRARPTEWPVTLVAQTTTITEDKQQ